MGFYIVMPHPCGDATPAAIPEVSQSVSEDPWGHLDDRDAQLFCEALSGYGCDHSCCTQMYPELPGLPPGPVVHVPLLDQQATREMRSFRCQGYQAPQAPQAPAPSRYGRRRMAPNNARDRMAPPVASAPKAAVEQAGQG
eukprot:Skav215604  [mRNA]  locus=scaffold666:451334:451753:- [translate_table: standard]